MESLQDILGSRSFAPSEEFEVIKDYVERKYKAKCHVRADKTAIIISVASPTLASVIYLERRQLIEACGLTKRLVVRAGR